MDKSERVSAKTTPSSGDKFKDVIKGLIKLLMLVIFLGNIFIWILMPTLIYRTKWFTCLTLFMLMFPMLLLACLGCQCWLIFLAMFVALLLWNFFIYFPVHTGGAWIIKYHIWLGRLLMSIFTVHGLCFVIYWASMHEISQMVTWSKTEMSNVAGEIALLSGLVIFLLQSLPLQVYIIFMFFYVLHKGVAFCFIVFPGFYMFMVDRFLSFLQSRDNVRLLSARVLPSNTVELTFSKAKELKYNPTSSLFVNIPSISKLQWHPFTITSSSNLEEETLSIVIKSEGKWSTKLYQMLSYSDHTDRTLSVSVEDRVLHDTLVMVSGGSRITPFIFIIHIGILDLILPSSGLELSSDLTIQVEAFITKDNEPSNEEMQKIRTIWFKLHT
ncbi:hypothetical protein Bca52824_002238 [Brassica carinata]|uniref:FAD-binding FR-type domain-containing protein n=1 Tax=Brassica carinata TaxID=52824 RepID=A0A8X8BE47_BRACI|nr:hypothetical protein Bca52824_002238 [Brassica carinata]